MISGNLNQENVSKKEVDQLNQHLAEGIEPKMTMTDALFTIAYQSGNKYKPQLLGPSTVK